MSKILKGREYIVAWVVFLLCLIGGAMLVSALLPDLVRLVGHAGYHRRLGGLILIGCLIIVPIVVAIMIARKVEEWVKKLTTGEKDEGSKEGS